MADYTSNTCRIFAVVLAAGEARRFGRTKQLLRLPGHDDSLVRHAARLAAETCGKRSLLVAGHDASAIVADAAGHCGFVAVNEEYAKGLSSSVACAVRSVGHAADALLLMLADQPRITAAHLAGLCSAWTGDAGHIVATAFDGDVGAPALLPRGTFDRLAALTGDRGAKSLFDAADVRLTSLRFDDAAIDIDTPNDLASLGRL